MPGHRRVELLPALLAALAAPGCAVDDVGSALMNTHAAVTGDWEPPTPDEEFPEVRTNCRLPGATLAREGKGWRLYLPSEIFAARERQPTAVHVGCVTDWARARGLALIIAEAH